MERITVNTAQPYDVLIARGILSQTGQRMRSVVRAGRVAVISDSNVWPLYGEKLLTSLRLGGYSDVVCCVFPAGEKNKNAVTYLQILDFMANNRMTRDDSIVALGGGVVGDLAGFVAATYLRGIDYIHIPTTLLAMVDSSVGGKTAIDLHAGKNLVGAFYQPKLVLCDPDTLDTLPDDVFRDGCAEVIKYSILYDKNMFEQLFLDALAFDRESVIARCIALKRDVVVADEFDRGQRQLLNLGHTFGHAIEAVSNYAVSHGEAVAVGMAMICRAAVKRGLAQTEADRIIELIRRFKLPAKKDISAEEIYHAALLDKKCGNDSINLIIPCAVGSCRIVPTPISELKAIIEEGL